jgi:WhiB family redox-sensing transcriptional regulator
MTHDWSTEAICLQEDPELFFPSGDGGRAQGQIEMARSVCARCPVRSDCLTLALTTDAKYGIWAGTTPVQRRRLRRRAGLASTPRRVVRRTLSELSRAQEDATLSS